MEQQQTISKPGRLMSLDVLRGVDLFLLVALCPLLLRLPIEAPWYSHVVTQLTHVSWQGFALWDLVMPLFMFMSGVTIPFALEKFRDAPKGRLYLRLLKRVALLWILGMVVQGNLLSLDPLKFKVFSNTLQAIAVGYFFSAIVFIHFRARWRYVIAVALLVGYWILMRSLGDFTPSGNLAEAVDRAVLGAWRDGATWAEDGSVQFAPWYFYTWILSSMTFVVTCLSGVFAGEFLKKSSLKGVERSLRLGGAGVMMVALGWIWGMDMPVIKTIWTSSMVLVSSGYCLLLLSLFYYLIDVKGRVKGVKWLSIYGMNSILAYSLSETPYMRVLARSLSGGLKQYTGDYFSLVVEIVMVVMIFFILRWMYKNNKFLRV